MSKPPPLPAFCQKLGQVCLLLGLGYKSFPPTCRVGCKAPTGGNWAHQCRKERNKQVKHGYELCREPGRARAELQECPVSPRRCQEQQQRTEKDHQRSLCPSCQNRYPGAQQLKNDEHQFYLICLIMAKPTESNPTAGPVSSHGSPAQNLAVISLVDPAVVEG